MDLSARITVQIDLYWLIKLILHLPVKIDCSLGWTVHVRRFSDLGPNLKRLVPSCEKPDLAQGKISTSKDTFFPPVTIREMAVFRSENQTDVYKPKK